MEEDGGHSVRRGGCPIREASNDSGGLAWLLGLLRGVVLVVARCWNVAGRSKRETRGSGSATRRVRDMTGGVGAVPAMTGGDGAFRRALGCLGAHGRRRTCGREQGGGEDEFGRVSTIAAAQ